MKKLFLNNTTKISDKKYQIIYVDPPWRYRKYTVPPNRTIENHYPTMSLEEIKKISIPAANNCLLCLWATSPKLEEALQVLKAWGFDYRSSIIWDKKDLGMGHWARIQHEILLFGVKGKFKPPPISLRIRSIISIRKGNHSDKPDYFRNKIEEWYPDFTKIELFKREHTPLFPNNKWDSWGNE